jgi:hypothetical protein
VVSVTESTLDVTALASGLEVKAVIAEENCVPFCSSCTRLLFGVEWLKKRFQLVVIASTAAAELAPLGLAGAAAAEAELLAGAGGEAELELLEEQAVMAVATNAKPRTATARPRRPVSWNRMSPLFIRPPDEIGSASVGMSSGCQHSALHDDVIRTGNDTGSGTSSHGYKVNRARQGGADPQSLGLEHLRECGGEEAIAIIMNEEPQCAGAAQIHGKVAGLLHRPCPGRVRGLGLGRPGRRGTGAMPAACRISTQ